MTPSNPLSRSLWIYPRSNERLIDLDAGAVIGQSTALQNINASGLLASKVTTSRCPAGNTSFISNFMAAHSFPFRPEPIYYFHRANCKSQSGVNAALCRRTIGTLAEKPEIVANESSFYCEFRGVVEKTGATGQARPRIFKLLKA